MSSGKQALSALNEIERLTKKSDPLGFYSYLLNNNIVAYENKEDMADFLWSVQTEGGIYYGKQNI